MMKNFTNVKAIGGIGNQLFVLAFGLAVSKRLKNQLVIESALSNLIYKGIQNPSIKIDATGMTLLTSQIFPDQ